MSLRDYVKLSIFFFTIVNIVTVFVHIQFNMMGSRHVPSFIPFLVENAKSLYRTPGENIRGSIHTLNVTRDLVGKPETTSYKVTKSSDKHYTIMWHNKPSWAHVIQDMNDTDCEFKNCRYTMDKTEIMNSSAILFCLTNPIEATPPLRPEERPVDQVWIFFSMEAPVNMGELGFRHASWKDTMNWSMTYRLDSDILASYGILEPVPSPDPKDYKKIFSRKTKFAAWIVSHCGAESGRDKYVQRLKELGIPVDIFGMCGDNVFHNRTELTELVNDQYKFYLSFENSFCRDYITEKLFSYYNLDVVLVVRGGANYNKIFLDGSFINTADYESIEKLADYLKVVGESEELYTKYLKRKNMFKAVGARPYCEVCEKLNNLEDNRKMYSDIIPYLYDDTCWQPPDISYFYYRLDFFHILTGLSFSFIGVTIVLGILLLLNAFIKQNVFQRCK